VVAMGPEDGPGSGGGVGVGLFKDRHDAQIDRYGTSLTLNGATAFKAFIHLLEPLIISSYFTTSEASQIIRPGLRLEAKPNLAVVVNDTFTLDGRTYTIKKIATHYIGEEAVFKILLAY